MVLAHPLIHRLETLAAALVRLALGAVGAETDRLDARSDLDFLVLVRDAEAKACCIATLDWLAELRRWVEVPTAVAARIEALAA